MFEVYEHPEYSVNPIYDEEDGLTADNEGALISYSDVILTGFQVASIGVVPAPTDFLIDIVDDEGFHYFGTFCCGDDAEVHYELVECLETGGTSEPWDECEY